MRKLRLSPIQNSILRLLEEAGEETSGTVFATLRSEGVDDRRAINAALEGLESLGLIRGEAASWFLTKEGYESLLR